MKIIDKTPLQDANGNINIIARVQGTLEIRVELVSPNWKLKKRSLPNWTVAWKKVLY